MQRRWTVCFAPSIRQPLMSALAICKSAYISAVPYAPMPGALCTEIKMFRITDGQHDYGLFYDREVAEVIAQEFRREGLDVDVRALGDGDEED